MFIVYVQYNVSDLFMHVLGAFFAILDPDPYFFLSDQNLSTPVFVTVHNTTCVLLPDMSVSATLLILFATLDWTLGII